MKTTEKFRFHIGFKVATNMPEEDAISAYRMLMKRIGETATQAAAYASGFRHGLVARCGGFMR